MENEELQSTRFEGAIPNAEQLTSEQVDRVRATLSAKDARDAAERHRQELEDQENKVKSDRLRELRTRLFGQGEAGIMQGRYATTISDETMRQVQKDIAVGERVLQSAASGVLTKGNVDRQTMPPVAGVEYAGTAVGGGLDLSNVEDNSEIYNEKPMSDAEFLRERRRKALQRGQELHQEAELIRDTLEGVGVSTEAPASKPKLSDLNNAA